MTSHERLMAAMRGEPVDRLPWSPFLAYWWESQPRSIQDKGQPWFFKEIGADTLLRGFTTPFKVSYRNCRVIEEKKGDMVYTRHETPVGKLVTISRYSADGDTTFVIDHPVKTKEDFKILISLVENMVIEPDYAPTIQLIEDLGDDGVLVPLISPFYKTPFQDMVEHWLGTQQVAYSLADYPEIVEECLEVMSQKALEAVKISVACPAEAYITWEDSSTTNISPRFFDRYIVPDMNRWGNEIHKAGKLFLHHACGHVRSLVKSMAKEEIDIVESLTPPPTGNIEIWEAQSVLGDKVGVIGGIEPTAFLFLDIPELTQYVEVLLSKADLNHFILANSDSCPPGVSVEKFKRVTEIARMIKF